MEISVFYLGDEALAGPTLWLYGLFAVTAVIAVIAMIKKFLL